MLQRMREHRRDAVEIHGGESALSDEELDAQPLSCVEPRRWAGAYSVHNDWEIFEMGLLGDIGDDRRGLLCYCLQVEGSPRWANGRKRYD